MTDRVELMLPATDSYRLRATIWEGADDAPTVIIAPATGVQRGYYRSFAQFLADAGFQVVTFDARGIGESRPVSLKEFNALMQDWGEKDLAGVIAWLNSAKPDSKLLLVGHSSGGQLVGFAPNRDKLRGMLFVAAQTGYWGHWTGWRRLAVKTVWYVAIPLLTNIFGYFPAKRLGMGEDLPMYVAQQWAEWSRSPGYLFDHVLVPIQDAYRAMNIPIRAYSFTDDQFYAPRAAVDHLLTYYESALKEHLHVDPADLGLQSIGHWGFFRESVAKEKLWPEAAEWLRAQLVTASG